MFGIATYGTLKLSILLLYRRIFVGKIFQRVSLAMVILVALWVTAIHLRYSLSVRNKARVVLAKLRSGQRALLSLQVYSARPRIL